MEAYKSGHIYIAPLCSDKHWYLCIARTPTIEEEQVIQLSVLDGFGQNDSGELTNIRNLTKQARKIINNERVDGISILLSYIKSLPDCPKDIKHQQVDAITHPKQNDGWSCGYFIIGWILYLCENSQRCLIPIKLNMRESFINDTYHTVVSILSTLLSQRSMEEVTDSSIDSSTGAESQEAELVASLFDDNDQIMDNRDDVQQLQQVEEESAKNKEHLHIRKRRKISRSRQLLEKEQSKTEHSLRDRSQTKKKEDPDFITPKLRGYKKQ